MKYLSILLLITHTITQPFYDFCQKNGKKIAPTYKKANCTQFMDQILKDYLNIDDPKLSKYIHINYPLDYIEKCLEENKIEVVGGAPYGLVTLGYANWVELKNIQRGDIVQYWSLDGFTNGHVGVFHGYDQFGNIILVGSHQDSNGYGRMNCLNKSINCKFYVCRLKL